MIEQADPLAIALWEGSLAATAQQASRICAEMKEAKYLPSTTGRALFGNFEDAVRTLNVVVRDLRRSLVLAHNQQGEL